MESCGESGSICWRTIHQRLTADEVSAKIRTSAKETRKRITKKRKERAEEGEQAEPSLRSAAADAADVAATALDAAIAKSRGE